MMATDHLVATFCKLVFQNRAQNDGTCCVILNRDWRQIHVEHPVTWFCCLFVNKTAWQIWALMVLES